MFASSDVNLSLVAEDSCLSLLLNPTETLTVPIVQQAFSRVGLRDYHRPAGDTNNLHQVVLENDVIRLRIATFCQAIEKDVEKRE